MCVHLPVTNEFGLGFLQFSGMPDSSYFKVYEPYVVTLPYVETYILVVYGKAWIKNGHQNNTIYD